MPFDWATVRSQLRTDAFMLLAKAAPYSTAEAVRAGRVKAMVGVQVRTRNNHYVDGRRVCDIYLKESEAS